MTTNILFGTLLRQLRIVKNIKLKDMALKVGMDKGLLSKIENNERRATKEQLHKFIQILEADPKELKTSWLATKLLYELEDMDYGLEALMVAETVVKDKSDPQDLVNEVILNLDTIRSIMISEKSFPREYLEFMLSFLRHSSLHLAREEDE